MFNAAGTPVMNGEGFPTEREARRDAENFKQELSETQVIGEVYGAALGE